MSSVTPRTTEHKPTHVSLVTNNNILSATRAFVRAIFRDFPSLYKSIVLYYGCERRTIVADKKDALHTDVVVINRTRVER